MTRSRTVDDEGAVVGHERNLAHVHFLLLDFLDGLFGRFLVEDDKADPGTQGRREGQATLLTLLHVEGRLTEVKLHELQPRVAAVAGDREDGIEGSLKALVGPALKAEYLPAGKDA